MIKIWEWFRKFTPWRRVEADTTALYRYLWSDDGKPLTSGTLITERDGVKTATRIVDGRVI
jgi:hypothetical protein